jgi:hypothetical protein
MNTLLFPAIRSCLASCLSRPFRLSRLPLVLSMSLIGGLSAFGQNLLTNGSFTSTDTNGDPTNWVMEDAAIVSIDTADYPAGATRSLKVDLPVNQGSSLGQIRQSLNVASTGAPLTPNTAYLARVWVKSTVTGQARLQIKRYDSSNTELDRTDSQLSTTGWTQVRVGFDTGNAARVEFILRYAKDSTVTGQVARFATAELLDGAGSTLGTLTFASTFESASVYAPVTGAIIPGPTGHQVDLAYRPTGTTPWLTALPPDPSTADGEFRGSLLLLQPATTYDVQVTLKLNGTVKSQVTGTVTTWSESATIATDNTMASSTTSTYTITAQGSATGWVRYKAASGGSTVDVGSGSDYAIYVNNAAYVIIEGLTLKGGKKATIYVNNSHHIWIRGCDISGWSEAGTFGADKDNDDEFPYGYYNGTPFEKAKTLIALRAGIYVTGTGASSSSQVIIERNLIHHPVGKAASWTFDQGSNHPAGPSGIILHATLGNHVIRYNDIVAGAGHFFNDAIESKENGQDNGGPYRDTDIYGNLLAGANDDGTELDGGQMNVRYWQNWVEGANSGISTAPNRKGPSYVFRNILVDGDERLMGKNGFKLGGQPGVTYFVNNTVYSQGYGFTAGNYGGVITPLFTRNNVFTGPVAGNGLLRMDDTGWAVDGDIDYDLYPVGGIKSATTGWEANGVAAHPDFTDAPARSFLLAPGSAGTGAAAAVTGIATAGSDLGAVTTATSLVSWPVRASAPNLFPMRTVVRLRTGTTAVATLALDAPSTTGATWTAAAGESWLSLSPATGSSSSSLQGIDCTVNANGLVPGLYHTFVTVRTNTGLLRTALIDVEVDPATDTLFSQEAESANMPVGFTSVTDASASGGAYAHAVSEGAQTLGAIPVNFTLSSTQSQDSYYVHVRVRADGPSSLLQTQNSFSLHIDETGTTAHDYRWDLAALGTDWSWETAYVEPATVSPALLGPISFSAGSHFIEIEKRESGVQLDRIVVSNSPFPPRTATPALSPTGGTFSGTQSVTITSATSGAFIRYTTDGSTPTPTHGTVYSSPVSVAATTLLQAIAYSSQLEDSPVTADIYTIGAGGGGGGIGDTFQMSANEVVVEAEHYTTATSGDGHDWTLYTQAGASGISTNNAIRATPNIGTGYASFTATAARVDYSIDVPSGSASSFYVHLRHLGPTTSDDSVYLSIDGSTSSPLTMTFFNTLSWKTSSTALAIPAGRHTLTLWMREDGAIVDKIVINNSATTPTGNGPSESAPAPAQVAAPAFSPAAGTYSSAQSVSITSATSGATLRYTTDGSTPTPSHGTIVSGAVNIASTATLKAIAYKSGLVDSAVTSGTYTITIPAFQMSSNQVVMEAENFTTNVTGTDTWTPITDASASGAASNNALQSLTNDGTAYATLDGAAARLEYLINVPSGSATSFYVHIRDYGATSNDDSVYVSIDNSTTVSQVVSAGRTLDWKSSPATLTLSSGLHTITVWDREDGVEIDKIVLNTSSTAPTGSGPAESSRN